MYVRRINYNKSHRCPGWDGGGWRGVYYDTKPAWWDDLPPLTDFETNGLRRRHWWQARSRCDDGRIWTVYRTDPWRIFRWHRCSKCDVRAIPEWTKWADPTYWWFHIRYAIPWSMEYFIDDYRRRGLWKAIKRLTKDKIWTIHYRTKTWFSYLAFYYLPSRKQDRRKEAEELREHYFGNK